MDIANLTPPKIVELLDKRVVGQLEAKRAIAIAIRNRWRREQLPAELRRLCKKQNILLKGPTGSGKTELARAVAEELQWPIHFVDITQYTESGYQGKELNDIVKEFADNVKSVPDWARVGGELAEETNENEPFLEFLAKVFSDQLLSMLSILRGKPQTYHPCPKITAKEAKELSGEIGVLIPPGSLEEVLRTCFSNIPVDALCEMFGMGLMFRCLALMSKGVTDESFERIVSLTDNTPPSHLNLEEYDDNDIDEDDILLKIIAKINNEYKLQLVADNEDTLSSAFEEKCIAVLTEATQLNTDLAAIVMRNTNPKTKPQYPELLRLYARLAMEYLVSVAASSYGIKLNKTLSGTTIKKTGANSLARTIGVKVSTGKLDKILGSIVNNATPDQLQIWIAKGLYGRQALLHGSAKGNGSGFDINKMLEEMGLGSSAPKDEELINDPFFCESTGLTRRAIADNAGDLKNTKETADELIATFKVEGFSVHRHHEDDVLLEFIKYTLEPLRDTVKGVEFYDVYESTVISKKNKGGKRKGAKLSIREFIELYGIIFIDEIDKLGEEEGSRSMVSRSGVQRSLLALTEGTVVGTKLGSVDTENILFIGAGAFAMTSLDRLMPELRGRFPLVANIHKLTREDYIEILKSPNSAMAANVALCKVEGIDLVIDDDCYEVLADRCVKANEEANLGARRLQSIVSEAFQKLMFNAHTYKGTKVIYSKETLEKDILLGEF